MKDQLINGTTYGGFDDEQYKKDREYFMKEPFLRDKIPDFIKEYRSFNDFLDYVKETLPFYKEGKVFFNKMFSDILFDLEEKLFLIQSPGIEVIHQVISENNISDYVNDTGEKVIEQMNDDPEGAITIARTLLESVSKFILDQSGIVYKNRDDLPKLFRKVQQDLNLSPSEYTNTALKQILQGTYNIVSGLGELRNDIGDSHGKGVLYYKPSKRHA